jgi:hypothetical protein
MDRWRSTEAPPPSIEPRTCPDCGAPLQGYWRASGQWQWVVCGCRDTDIDTLEAQGRVTRMDNSLQDALGEPHDPEGRR